MEQVQQLTSSTMTLDSIILLSFYVLVGIYIIFSVILHYHWRAYGIDAKVTDYTLSLYYFITVPILLIMGILQFVL